MDGPRLALAARTDPEDGSYQGVVLLSWGAQARAWDIAGCPHRHRLARTARECAGRWAATGRPPFGPVRARRASDTPDPGD